MARSLQPSSAHESLAHYDKRESESDHVCVIQLCSLFDFSSHKRMSRQFGGGNTHAREIRHSRQGSEQAGRGTHVTRLQALARGRNKVIRKSLCAATPARLSCRKHGTSAKDREERVML